MPAIYQSARPIHWDEVVGQEHVKNVLRPALERGRIGHAYLFSGPRGVGKTTTARLIAMTVNCQTEGIKPCGHCESCKSVIAGRHPDVLEIDAASNNSVDDVRDLREKVALQPMQGSKKVYILDEAHMMSKSAFNALLKTLEEPPSHAVFVLATTEPERLPPTILSRCQHYRFRRLSAEEIAGKLGKTAQAEGVNAMPAALALMARASDGAMRDGESLLERLLAAGEPILTLEMVEAALGLPPQDRIEALALALARGETGRVMQSLGTFYSDGFAPRTITERVKVALRDQLHDQLGLGKRSQESFGEAHLLHLIKTLDEEDARFARSRDLISLELAFTKALIAEQPQDNNAVSPALETRVANLEKQVRGAFHKIVDEGLRASGQRPVQPNLANPLPEFDPMARSQPRRPAAPPDEAPFVAEPPTQEPQTRDAPPPARNPQPASAKGWADVILKADLRFRAILKEAKGHLSADVLVIEYSNPKHKWHAEQVSGKLEEVGNLVQQVIGEGIGLELVMPDGSKKNARNQPSLAPASRTIAEPIASALPAVLEESMLASAPQEKVQEKPEPLLENLSYITSGETPPTAPTQPVKPEPLQTLESQLAFQSLGEPQANPSLFSPAEIVASLEPETALTAKPPTTPNQQLESDFPDLPPEAFSESVFDSLAPASLETYDLEQVSSALPIAALEMDFADLDAPIAAKQSSLAGHPNYQLLSKLFAHRVREVGQLTAKTELANEDPPPVSSDEGE